jgi:hypothetical protein
MIKQAYEIGLAAIAISDHDSIDGVQPAIWASEKYGVEVIPGVELSSQIGDREFHILGYFIDWHNKWFWSKLSSLQEFRKKRARKMVERLRDLGMDISYNMIIARAGGVIGRPHIASAMVERGYVRTMDEAFSRYLKIGMPAYVAKYPLSPAKAIKMIQRVGGIPALAHPVFARADDMLPELVEQGLRGIEVYHTKHDAQTTRHYEQLARKYNLLVVGGSDSHGSEDAPIGNVRIPYSHVEKLKEEQLISQGITAGTLMKRGLMIRASKLLNLLFT